MVSDSSPISVNERSVSVAYLSAILKGGKKLPATGFLIRREAAILLVSNWHVFSGRDYQTGQCLSPDGAEPDQLELSYHSTSDAEPPTANRLIFRKELTVSLKDKGGNSRWRQHPTIGQRVDIAIMNLSEEGDFDHRAITVPNWDRELPEPLTPGEDVFILGFPRGLALTEGIAIWKRGSVATEPRVPIHGISKFLVDTATREGMSGSPVFVTKDFAGHKTSNLGLSLLASDLFFVGVYSGRYGASIRAARTIDDEIFEAQLGIVFPQQHLFEIVRNGIPGTFDISQKISK